MTVAPADRSWPEPAIRDALAQLRRRRPLTHCITNFVAMDLTANALLAIGASPAMVLAREEVEEFAELAGSLVVNVGTVTTDSAQAMRAAVAAAEAAHTPWVLDPVAVGPLRLRTELCVELLERRPAIVRGNGSEVLALAGQATGGRGVDSVAGSAEAVPAAMELAERTDAVVAVSGAVDQITDGRRVVRVPGGHELLTLVTGTGCALGALMAAFLTAADSPLEAAVAASAVLAAAAERAAVAARGPGGFRAALLDELYALGQEPRTVTM